MSGELPINEYMAWAADHYKIPFLSDDFFKQTNNFKLLLQNPSPQWSQFFFPISEWQGTLYIGCLEPQALTLEKKSCCVLSSPAKLLELWLKMEKQPVKTNPATASISATINTTTPPAKPLKSPAQPATASAPSAFPTSKFSLEETKSEIFKPENTHTSTGFNLPPLGEKTGQIEISKIVVPSATKSTPSKNPSGASGFDIPEITNVAMVNTQITKTFNKEFTGTKTISPFPEKSTQFTFIRTVYSQQVILDANSKIQENSNPQDALVSAFRILKDYYNKIMWVVRDQKGYAFPIACNATWDFTETAWNEPINFKTPNPFRIAKLTQKPFHGPVSPNPTSDAFFKNWCNSTYPDVLSIVPVKLHGKVFGYLVACEKADYFSKDQSLILMESVCNELVTTFMSIHKELNKAS